MIPSENDAPRRGGAAGLEAEGEIPLQNDAPRRGERRGWCSLRVISNAFPDKDDPEPRPIQGLSLGRVVIP